MDYSTVYRELIDRFKENRLLDSIGSVVSWDQHTYMPLKGANHRAEQMGYLAKLGHEKLTAARIGECLVQLEGSPLVQPTDSVESVNVREIRRVYDRAVKMPSKLERRNREDRIAGAKYLGRGTQEQ
jgi:carboxypeptidase Taq